MRKIAFTLDAAVTAVHDDLSDIDKKRPLSIHSLKRIVRAARRDGRLTLDGRDYYGEEFRSPHTVVDDFLGGLSAANQCSCSYRDRKAREFLGVLDKMALVVLVYRLYAPEDLYGAALTAQFDDILSADSA